MFFIGLPARSRVLEKHSTKVRTSLVLARDLPTFLVFTPTSRVGSVVKRKSLYFVDSCSSANFFGNHYSELPEESSLIEHVLATNTILGEYI